MTALRATQPCTAVDQVRETEQEGRAVCVGEVAVVPSQTAPVWVQARATVGACLTAPAWMQAAVTGAARMAVEGRWMQGEQGGWTHGVVLAHQGSSWTARLAQAQWVRLRGAGSETATAATAPACSVLPSTPQQWPDGCSANRKALNNDITCREKKLPKHTAAATSMGVAPSLLLRLMEAPASINFLTICTVDSRSTKCDKRQSTNAHEDSLVQQRCRAQSCLTRPGAQHQCEWTCAPPGVRTHHRTCPSWQPGEAVLRHSEEKCEHIQS